MAEGTDKTVRIGADLDPQVRLHLIEVLRQNADLFAYSIADMPDIDPEVVTHKISVYDGVKPKKQKKRNFGAEKDKIIEEEVQKLLDAGFIEECLYPDWLANVVLVRKPQPSKWRMCIDFTSLNKCCPKDCYPLPRIGQLVDSTAGYALLSCMDAFFGYHQIFLL
ncbi:unnamed protein product, partial [Amaranthus hypochondriacus]